MSAGLGPGSAAVPSSVAAAAPSGASSTALTTTASAAVVTSSSQLGVAIRRNEPRVINMSKLVLANYQGPLPIMTQSVVTQLAHKPKSGLLTRVSEAEKHVFLECFIRSGQAHVTMAPHLSALASHLSSNPETPIEMQVALSMQSQSSLLDDLYGTVSKYIKNQLMKQSALDSASGTAAKQKDLSANHRYCFALWLFSQVAALLHARVSADVQVDGLNGVVRVIEAMIGSDDLVSPDSDTIKRIGRFISLQPADALVTLEFYSFLDQCKKILNDIVLVVTPSDVEKCREVHNKFTNDIQNLLRRITETMFSTVYLYRPDNFDYSFRSLSEACAFGDTDTPDDEKLFAFMSHDSTSHEFYPTVVSEKRKIEWRELLLRGICFEAAMGEFKKNNHDYLKEIQALKKLESLSYISILRAHLEYKKLNGQIKAEGGAVSADVRTRHARLLEKLKKTQSLTDSSFSLDHSLLLTSFTAKGAPVFSFSQGAGLSEAVGRRNFETLLNRLCMLRNSLVIQAAKSGYLGSAFSALSPTLVLSGASITTAVSHEQILQCLTATDQTITAFDKTLGALLSNSKLSIASPEETVSRLCLSYARVKARLNLYDLSVLNGMAVRGLHLFASLNQPAALAEAARGGLEALDDLQETTQAALPVGMILPLQSVGALRDVASGLSVAAEKQKRLAGQAAIAKIADVQAAAATRDGELVSQEEWADASAALLDEVPASVGVDKKRAQAAIKRFLMEMKASGIDLEDIAVPVTEITEVVKLESAIRGVRGATPAQAAHSAETGLVLRGGRLVSMTEDFPDDVVSSSATRASTAGRAALTAGSSSAPMLRAAASSGGAYGSPRPAPTYSGGGINGQTSWASSRNAHVGWGVQSVRSDSSDEGPSWDTRGNRK